MSYVGLSLDLTKVCDFIVRNILLLSSVPDRIFFDFDFDVLF
jgi:hypothetical protein